MRNLFGNPVMKWSLTKALLLCVIMALCAPGAVQPVSADGQKQKTDNPKKNLVFHSDRHKFEFEYSPNWRVETHDKLKPGEAEPELNLSMYSPACDDKSKACVIGPGPWIISTQASQVSLQEYLASAQRKIKKLMSVRKSGIQFRGPIKHENTYKIEPYGEMVDGVKAFIYYRNGDGSHGAVVFKIDDVIYEVGGIDTGTVDSLLKTFHVIKH